ncbi:MAG: hypothetical protein HFE90_03305 [Firmicutes bacterium]|nr:hypothetical protein [Bacillota bacterium]
MTANELIEAIYEEYQVIYNGIEYKKVTGLTYKKIGGGIRLLGELLDKCGHSVTIAPAEKIERKT